MDLCKVPRVVGTMSLSLGFAIQHSLNKYVNLREKFR